MLPSFRKSLSLIAAGVLCLALKPNAPSLTPASGRMKRLPSRTLWVWERPEDLRSLNPDTTAIATLDRSIFLGNTTHLIPRHQPYRYPAGTARIAVVRIEAPGTIAPGLEKVAANLILDAAQVPDIAALQIDFDARRSQRDFYTELLRDLRRRMPHELPLSITALASWCSNDDWLRGLPIDEAVPMYFRMEPDRRYIPPDPSQSPPQWRIQEPLCMGSIGISTREQRRVTLSGKRVYIFPDRGWRQDLPLISENSLALRNEP